MNTFRILRTVMLCLSIFSASGANADNNPHRPFDIHRLNNVGLEVWVPARPKWVLSTDDREGVLAVLLSTPEKYYPSTVIEIVFNKGIKVRDEDLPQTAASTLSEIRKNAGVPVNLSNSGLSKVQFGSIIGYQDQFDVSFEGSVYTMQAIMGVFPSKQSVTLLVTTPKGQMQHIAVMKEKIFKKLSVLPR